MLSPTSHRAPQNVPPIINGTVPVPSAQPQRPRRRLVEEPEPEAVASENVAPLAFVSAALFLVSGVALQESMLASRLGYAFLGVAALATAIVLQLVHRMRRKS